MPSETGVSVWIFASGQTVSSLASQKRLTCIVHVQGFNSALSSLILLKLKLNHCLQRRLDLGDLVENDLPGR